MATVINDAQNKTTGLVSIFDSNSASTALSNLRCGVQYSTPNFPTHPGTTCDSVGAYYSNPTRLNFEPRVGFAWDPFRDGKTSVRGGFGIYDVLPVPAYFLVLQDQAAPFMIFDSIDKPSSPPNPLKGKFYSGGEALLTASGSQTGKLSTSVVEANPHRNYVLQWNLNVQRQISSDLSVTLGYVGSHGVHMLMRGDDGNMTIPTRTSAGLLFPCGPPVPSSGGPCTPGNNSAGTSAKVNQALGNIRYLFWGSDSFYDGMNLNIDKRMSHGLQFQIAYTWAKSIDDNSSTVAGDAFSNGLNSTYWFAPKSLRGRSDFNIGQSASINVLWAVPTPRSISGFTKSALGGWQVGSIFKVNSGVPTTVIVNGDPAGLGNGGADQFGIPNLIPGCDPVNHNYIGGTSPTYINVNCYALPTVSASSPLASQCGTFPFDPAHGHPVIPAPAGQVYCANLLGNAGRNSINGPMLVNMDFSATKNIPIHRISETYNIQFRAEIFNILNRSNFLPPEPLYGAGIYDANGDPLAKGFMDNLATQPRDVQFAIKMIW
jgi:hypothetical protein